MDIPLHDFDSVEDFLDNPQFRKWVRQEAPEDREFWTHWLETHPEKRELYETAVATLLVVQGNTAPSDALSKQKSQEILELINTPAASGRVLSLWRYAGWAAAMITLSIGLYWFSNQPKNRRNDTLGNAAAESEWVSVENHTKPDMLINLPDGSSLLLKKGSSIRFPKTMTGSRREVFLDGEGFFEVVKNREKPFYVYANELVTKVLGTSFLVKSYRNQPHAFVAVKTGKVSVTTNPGRKGAKSEQLTLLPNQQIKLSLNGNQLLKAISEPIQEEAKTPIQKETFEFEFTPVSEAFKTLEKNYGVSIQYDHDKMRNCTLTATLKDEPFLEKIRLICLITESTFQINNNHVTITGAGCQ